MSAHPAPPLAPFHAPARRWLASAAVLLVSAGLGAAFKPWLGEGYASLFFVLAPTLVGAIAGLRMAMGAALIGELIFNYFISEPVFSLQLERGTDFAVPVVMALCAVVSGVLSGRLRDEQRQLQQANLGLEKLIALSGDLLRAADAGQVHDVLLGRIQPHLGQRVGLYLAQEGQPAALGGSPCGPVWLEAAANVLADQPARLGGVDGWRLSVGPQVVGALLVEQAPATPAAAAFFTAMSRMVALALERAQLARALTEAQAAARAEELKSALLASVSHDLRSPLTAIHASASSLLTYGAGYDSETSQALLAGIVEESDRLNHLTANLLQMSRLQDGSANLHLALVPVGEFAQALAARLRRQYPRRQITLGPLGGAAVVGEVFVRADPALFEIALVNLVQNALRYSQENQPVMLGWGAEAGEVEIEVRDQGTGIAAADLPHVFERFYRGARVSARGPAGSGLGLAIAKGFVEACGGTIGVASPLPGGQGTAVTIRLPLASPGAPPCLMDPAA